ncbi:DUF4158 domain-containing protein [Streptosporangium sp. NPDC000396]|uniref:DUF4158 domain-containing protein n=1 Tax=Streptosporangium sp. NPDC000396 TaxID=3366185 RepID=UPI00367551B1
MARVFDEDELVDHWTLLDEEMELLAGRRGPTKLAFALMLKFHQLHGRFPRGRGELPDEAVEYVAAAVKVPASDLALYEWDGRTSKAHRTGIRAFTGFRECGVEDAEKAAEWLAGNVCKSERRTDRVRQALLAHLKDERIEPPSKQRLQRIVGSALEQSEKALTLRISSRISDEVIERMFALIARRSDAAEESQESPDSGDGEQDETPVESEGADVFAAIREDPGNVSVTTMEKEVFKLGAIKAIGLPEDVFDDIAPGVLLSWRARVAVSSPSHLRRHGHELRVTLLAAYLHCRRREIIDALGGPADHHRAPHQCPRRHQGHRGVHRRVEARVGQGEHPVQDDPGRAGGT